MRGEVLKATLTCASRAVPAPAGIPGSTAYLAVADPLGLAGLDVEGRRCGGRLLNLSFVPFIPRLAFAQGAGFALLDDRVAPGDGCPFTFSGLKTKSYK